MATNKILAIVTNTNEYRKAGFRTGLWLGELTHFLDHVTEQGFEVDIASPAGGYVPIDPESLSHDVLGDGGTMDRYRDRAFMDRLVDTPKASDLNVEDYDAIYFTGGHGVLFDFRDPELAAFTARFHDAGKVVSAVCHGPAGLLDVTLANGELLLHGRQATGFTWAEEEGAQRADIVPFDLEAEVTERAGGFSCADEPFASHVVTDDRLITGQNPASARGVAEALVKELRGS